MKLRVRHRPRLKCPLCLDAMGPDDGACEACATPQHAACLSEFRRCALLGCVGPRVLRPWVDTTWEGEDLPPLEGNDCWGGCARLLAFLCWMLGLAGFLRACGV